MHRSAGRFIDSKRPVIGAGGLGAVVLSVSALAAPPEGYLDEDALAARVHDLAAHEDRCSLAVVGESREGRDLLVLTLAADVATADERPALLVTAGLDARHLVGTETAVRLAERLLAEHADVLEVMTVYVIPRANPDGVARWLAGGPARPGTAAPVDEDRDGAVDEDAPSDLDGDGVITMMRRPEPPLDDRPTHLADPAAPRLLKKADAAAGERAVYSVYPEGLDRDGDGLVAEDGPGMVDLDHNFMHEWPEHDRDSGAYQLSEPEAAALAAFVLEHRNIACALTLGRHDNLVNVPDGKGRDVSGRGPKVLDKGDVRLYERIAEVYEETTGQKRAPKEPVDGSFHAWMYAQRGIPSFASTVWGRPDEKKDDPAPDAADAEAAPDGGPPPAADPVAGSWSGSIEIPDMGGVEVTLDVERRGDDAVAASLTSPMFGLDLEGTFEADSGALTLAGSAGPEMNVTMDLTVDGDRMTGTASSPQGGVDIALDRAGGGAAGGAAGGGRDKGDKPSDGEAAAWLAYSDDQRDGAGFVEWAPFDHPTLGPVEIGGFVPGFRRNPPAGDLDDLAAGLTAFAVELVERRPRTVVVGPEVTRLADGLYEVRFGLRNDGALPTGTAMARTARAHPPTIVRVSTPVERIVAGNRVSRTWGIDGHGGRFVQTWLLRVDPDEDVTVEVRNAQLGDQLVTFRPGEAADQEGANP
jgi:hypothetical protein